MCGGGRPWACPAGRASVFEALDRSAAETVCGGFPEPLDHAGVVVAIAEIVVQRGEAVLLAGVLHVLELAGLEFVAIHGAPVVRGGEHGEAGPEGAIGADDHVVVAGAAVPVGKAKKI